MEIIRAREDDRGVILIALLWILTILSVIALSFSRETFVEVGAARNSRDLADSYYIARAGIAATIYQLYQKSYLSQMSPADALSQQPDAIDFGKVTGKFGDGEYEVDVQDESGKINVNTVGEEQLKALVAVIGIPEPDADIIVDSILDWKDLDKIARQNGAEDEYYQSLQPPYLAKNGVLGTVEELLLVRGVTPEYYYGHRKNARWAGRRAVRPLTMSHCLFELEQDQRELRSASGAAVDSRHDAGHGAGYLRASSGETIPNYRGSQQRDVGPQPVTDLDAHDAARDRLHLDGFRSPGQLEGCKGHSRGCQPRPAGDQ